MKNEGNLIDGVNEFRAYKSQYQTMLGFNYAYERLVWQYSLVSVKVLDELETKQVKDSVRLGMALRATNEMNSIFRLFKYQSLPEDFRDESFLIDLSSLESRVLLALDKKEEAIQSLQRVLEYKQPDSLKEALNKRIIEIQSQNK